MLRGKESASELGANKNPGRLAGFVLAYRGSPGSVPPPESGRYLYTVTEQKGPPKSRHRLLHPLPAFWAAHL
jgi:hypothetical protein